MHLQAQYHPTAIQKHRPFLCLKKSIKSCKGATCPWRILFKFECFLLEPHSWAVNSISQASSRVTIYFLGLRPAKQANSNRRSGCRPAATRYISRSRCYCCWPLRIRIVSLNFLVLLYKADSTLCIPTNPRSEKHPRRDAVVTRALF